MTENQKLLVQGSFAQVLLISDAAAKIFYANLFQLDPSLIPLFKGDMVEQGRKLMSMIKTAVDGLDYLDKIVPAVQDLGKRHVKYGVKDSHYDTVGNALIMTLKEGLGAGFTPEVEEAWIVVYTLLATTMKDASNA